MIYVSEGKLIVTSFQLLAPLVLGGAPIFKPRKGGGAIAPPAPPGHHATDKLAATAVTIALKRGH